MAHRMVSGKKAFQLLQAFVAVVPLVTQVLEKSQESFGKQHNFGRQFNVLANQKYFTILVALP